MITFHQKEQFDILKGGIKNPMTCVLLFVALWVLI